ncbi:MAG: tyrosine-type recombinase/integrase [Clostridiaceae bacterium]
MRRKNEASVFLGHIEYFINTYLTETKGLSPNTVLSYKTTFKLLITFMYSVKRVDADQITFQNLTVDIITDFLNWMENERNCSASTKNQRLSALYSFSEYAQNRDFDAASVFRSAVIKIPTKNAPMKKRIAFTVEEVRIILSIPDQNKETGLRDIVLLSLMYATGARAQEMCDLFVRKIQFRNTNTTIDIVGKGRKARRVRIPDQCAVMLKKYLIHKGIDNQPDRHVFSSQTHEYMTISCIEAIFKKYTTKAKMQHPNLFQEESYPPHSMRHTTAQHMLEAGIPLIVIKSFLGHASVQTTQIYAESTQAAIDKNVREWNERNFPHDIYTTKEESGDSYIPDFLKGK